MAEKKIKCGDPIRTKIGHIEGIVTAVNTRFKHTTYEVSTVVGGEPRAFWMCRVEFERNDSGNKGTGFVK